MFKVTIRAGGIGSDIGTQAAQDIENEFRDHRQWHEHVTCSFTDRTLTLVALNDFDRDGRALSDEFSDCLCAFIPLDGMSDDGEFEIVVIETS
jgi:hypothetical protein